MSKITQLTPLSSPASNDLLVIVDTDDITMASTGTDKQITVAALLASAGGGSNSAVDTISSASGTVALNAASFNVYAVTMTGACTFTFAGAVSGDETQLVVYLSQDATGGRTAAWPGSVSWIGGTAPTLSTAPNAFYLLIFTTVNNGTTWYGSVIQELPALPLSIANGGTGQGTAATALAALGAAALAGATFTGWVAPSVTALTDAATIAVNAALGSDFYVTLGGSRTMGAPSNPLDGQKITFEIIQPASGGPYTVTWTSGAGGYSFGSGSAPTLSTAASATDQAAFRYSARKNRWLYLGSTTGF